MPPDDPPGQVDTNSIFIYALSLPSSSKSGRFSHFLKECNTHPSQLSNCITVPVQLLQQACEHFQVLQNPVVRNSL